MKRKMIVLIFTISMLMFFAIQMLTPIQAQASSLLLYNETALTALDGTAGDGMGASVAIDGDTAVIGAYGDDTYSGSAYVFVSSGGSWSQVAKLTASDRAANDNFGYSVSISGDTVAIGSYGDTTSQGSAYVFVKPGGGWADMTETAKLTASDGASSDYFGYSVGISGDTIIVGSEEDDISTHNDQGSAYVFVKPGGGWTTMTQTAKLTASDGGYAYGLPDHFGKAVAIDGDIVLVGAPYGDKTAGNDQGTAYIFVKPGGGWTNANETAKLTAGVLAGANHLFGNSVALDGNTALVGEPGYNAAYAFTGSGASWTQEARWAYSSTPSSLQFGYSVAIDGNTALVSTANTDTIPVSLYTRTGTTWTNYGTFMPTAPGSTVYYDLKAALSGSTYLVGNIWSNSFQGKALVYEPSFDLSVSETPWSYSGNLVYPGDSIDIKIDVLNSGPTSTTPFSVSVPIPSGFTYGSYSCTSGIYDSSTGVWTLGILNSGDSAALTLTITVGSSLAGTSTAIHADTSVSDLNSGNNSDTLPVDIAALAFSPTYANFGNYLIGTTSPAITITASNLASGSVAVGTLSIGAGFSLSNDNCSSAVLSVSGTCTFDIQFHPTSAIFYDDFVTVPVESISQQMEALGFGASGTGLQFNYTSISFGPQLIQTTSTATTVWVTNNITPDITLGMLSIDSGFKFTNNTCNNAVLSSGQQCSFEVHFAPATTIVYNGQITVPTSNGPDLVIIDGLGVAGTQLLTNGSFNLDANKNKVPDGWTKGGTWATADGYNTGTKRTGTASLKFTGNKLLKTLAFSKTKSGVAGDDFLLTLWSKATSVPTAGTIYSVTLKFSYSGTQVGTTSVNFAKGTHNFSKITLIFSAPADYTKVQVLISFKATAGMVYFDDASLLWAP